MKSTPSYSNQRVGIFVDVQNLYHSAKNLYRGRVNYAELLKHLVGDRQLIRAMAYVVKSEGIEPQHSDRAATIRPQHHLTEENGDLSSEAAFFSVQTAEIAGSSTAGWFPSPDRGRAGRGSIRIERRL